MHPTLLSAVAAERRADLLRAAAPYRHGVAQTTHRRRGLSLAAGRIGPLLAQLRRPAPATNRSAAILCCA